MKLLLLLSLFWACCAAIVKKKDTFLIRESVRHLSDHSHDWCESLNLLDGWCDEMPEADKIATTCWVGDLNPHEVLFFHKHDIIDEHLTELGDMQDCKEEGNCDYELLTTLATNIYYRVKYFSFIREDYGEAYEARHKHERDHQGLSTLFCLNASRKGHVPQHILGDFSRDKETLEKMARDMNCAPEKTTSCCMRDLRTKYVNDWYLDRNEKYRVAVCAADPNGNSCRNLSSLMRSLGFKDAPKEDGEAIANDLIIIPYGERKSGAMPMDSSALDFFDKRTAINGLLELVEDQNTNDLLEKQKDKMILSGLAEAKEIQEQMDYDMNRANEPTTEPLESFCELLLVYMYQCS